MAAGGLDFEPYFKPAFDLARLILDFNGAEGEKKSQIGWQIYSSEYIVRLRGLQSISGVGFLTGRPQPQNVNAIKKDFFYNPATPRLSQDASLYGMPYHRHDYLELVVVLKGQYTQSINGVLHCHQEGDICMLNPNVIHRDISPGPEDRVMFLGLSPNYLRGDMARWLKPHPRLAEFMDYQAVHSEQQYVLFHPREWEGVQAIILQILEEDTQKRPGHHAIIGGLLIRLFSILAQEGQYHICCQSVTEIHEHLIAEVLAYMEEHLASVNRESLAAFFHFNPDYLNKLLLQVTGRNYSSHLRELRLARAADQLRHTDLSVNTIIRELGFSNKGFFNRMFREKFGVLPGEYRAQ